MSLAVPVGVFAGLLAAAGWLGLRRRRLLGYANQKAGQLRADGTCQAENHLREASQERRNALGRWNQQREQRRNQDKERGLALEDDLVSSGSHLDTRRSQLASRQDACTSRHQRLMARRQSAVECSRTAARRRGGLKDALAQQAGADRMQLLERRVHEIVGRAQLQADMQQRHHEAHLADAAPAEARRVMALAMERYCGTGHQERSQNTVAMPDHPTFTALADPQSKTREALLSEIDCELEASEGQRGIVVRGDDPLAREMARRVLRQIANRRLRAPDRIRRLARQVRAEVDREIRNAGRKAARTLNIHGVHADILHLVGRLKYRLSYSQNQWKHAVEVGYLASILAEELKLDVHLARRGGLLHDIGKAMTHDHDGSHAVLGAAVARRCGENEVVANAIGSHHNDEPPTSPIAYIVTAADALSGARPGARREADTQFLQRNEAIQTLASRVDSAIERVDIMQGGREVRVFVAGEDVGKPTDDREQGRSQGTDALDTATPTKAKRRRRRKNKGAQADAKVGARVLREEELHPLAAQIARSLEESVTYAGQIRVTVIQQSCATSVAR